MDYGSDAASAARTADLCGQNGAEYVGVAEAPIWSRARCLNIGIRRAGTKFLMTSDVDIMLSPRYLSDAIRALDASPLSVVCSPMLDLPEESAAVVEEAASAGGELALARWKAWCAPRFGWEFHPSIIVAYTAFFRLIRGYDEFYELWGEKDADLLRRLRRLGLEPHVLGPESFYLHQWHPKFESVPGGRRADPIRRKRAYFRTHHSILRNDRNWGTAGSNGAI